MHKGKTPLAICLDFSKAFDTLDHEILLYKLKLYGIKDKDLFLFRHYLTYLTNRRQYQLSMQMICTTFIDDLDNIPKNEQERKINS